MLILYGCVAQSLSHVSPCDPMVCRTPGSSALHCLLEFVPIHAHWVGVALWPPLPLLPPSPFSFNLSQHHGLFQWVGSSHQAARVLEFQLQHQSFQWIFRVDFLYDWLVWSHLVQETLKSLLQHHKWEALILQGSAFSALLLLLGPCCFCPLLCPSVHGMFPWYLRSSWRNLCCHHYHHCCHCFSSHGEPIVLKSFIK